jgi:hypothetical protein
VWYLVRSASSMWSSVASNPCEDQSQPFNGNIRHRLTNHNPSMGSFGTV